MKKSVNYEIKKLKYVKKLKTTVVEKLKNKKIENSRVQETLTLLTCADNSIVSKTKINSWVQFGTPPCFQGTNLGGSRTERGDDPRVQSGTTHCF